MKMRVFFVVANKELHMQPHLILKEYFASRGIPCDLEVVDYDSFTLREQEENPASLVIFYLEPHSRLKSPFAGLSRCLIDIRPRAIVLYPALSAPAIEQACQQINVFCFVAPEEQLKSRDVLLPLFRAQLEDLVEIQPLQAA